MIPIGIDLGTTYSVVARVTSDGRVEVLPNAEGEPLTASAVHFSDDGPVAVGRMAKQLSNVESDRIVTAIKRYMGTEHILHFDGTDYRPEGISAIILRSLADAAATELGVEVGQLAAVITVPAYFGVAEREATAAAAEIAGLRWLDLVAEPVAAALFYGIGSGETGVILVYDLGGGTFDATIVSLTPGGPVPIAVDGSNELGGLNFDERLQNLVVERYCLATADTDAPDDEEFLLHVGAQIEGAKKALSRAESASVTIRRGESNARITVTREEFERASADLVAESLAVVDRVIASAGARGTARPQRAILVGGSTRMPMVKAGLEQHLNVPVQLSEPDLAVAKGAAIHARALANPPEPETRRMLARAGRAERLAASRPVRSVVARALGVKLMDSHDPTGERAFVEHVITANTPLPVPGTRARFATILPGQERVRVELMEQAGAVASPELAHNRRVLDGELVGLPDDLPAGSPIELTLSVGLDGRISCMALEPSSGLQLVLESYMEGVSDSDELEQQRSVVSALRWAR